MTTTVSPPPADPNRSHEAEPVGSIARRVMVEITCGTSDSGPEAAFGFARICSLLTARIDHDRVAE